jgi:hypothetical protein
VFISLNHCSVRIAIIHCIFCALGGSARISCRTKATSIRRTVQLLRLSSIRFVLSELRQSTAYFVHSSDLPGPPAEQATWPAQPLPPLYHGYPELYKLVLHLRQEVGAYECWGDVVNMPGGKFMNSVSDMERIALTRNFSYKWGATEDLCRRCYDLELLKSYSQVLWHPRSSTAEVASLEQALIEHYTSDKVPFQVRGRCDNRPNPKWGEGLRKDASPSFLYLAIRR